MLRILVVDDDELIRWSLRERLTEEGFEVETAGTGAEGREKIREGVDLILLDFELPDTNGLEILRELSAVPNSPPVIMLTAHCTVERAVKAMQFGAYHYARKPFDVEEVVILIRKALEDTKLRRTVRRLMARELEHAGLEKLVGESPAMRQVKETVVKIATSPATTVLITGESGTGKDVVARTIHTLSERREGPFMNITCSALPDTLLESELFGHERGAFTDARTQKRGLLEEADGGTVFLDEIGEMSPPLQAKLLRFLEDRAFRRVGGTREISTNVRVVAATNRNLEEAIRDGQFREDLYYRLAVLNIRMPPLRERGRDVRLLASYFVDAFNRDLGRSLRGFTQRALNQLERHAWPGNVRELRNTVERAVLLAEGEELDVSDLVPASQQAASRDPFVLPSGGLVLEELEISLVRQALERTGGNKSRAARLLGLTRDQVRHRVTKFGLDGGPAGSDEDDGDSDEEPASAVAHGKQIYT